MQYAWYEWHSPKAIFDKAGFDLDDEINKIRVPGHKGPHPELYQRSVYDRLLEATGGLNGDDYRSALRAELDALKKEAVTPGSLLNQLITKQPLD
ncbi:MAG: AHH domain-containing protein [Fuerstiella sp.]